MDENLSDLFLAGVGCLAFIVIAPIALGVGVLVFFVVAFGRLPW